MDCRTQKVEIACSTASRDLQEVTLKVAVNYNVSIENAYNIYKSIIVGLYFGLFQGIMPLISWSIGVSFKTYIENFEISINKRELTVLYIFLTEGIQLIKIFRLTLIFFFR